MVLALNLFGRGAGRGLARFFQMVMDGEPIALAIVGVLVLVLLVWGGITLYNHAITPESSMSDDDLTSEEKRLLDRFK
ncbi:hypothetical protein [Stieleria varia]|uniref:Uncharacterized protein n=1 Tax=Stieleria varia TaxID=2528005 RepID=A0A5C6B6A1_9BACT|nr:hypothetical protein [Stieleria varia]TWU07478.1 hypothetical protein Pla52n_00510 [Stieleria varia]